MPNPKAHGAEPQKTRPLTGSPPSTPTRGPTMQDNDRARRHRRPAAQAGQPLLADLNDRQREAATAPDGPVLVIAGPGSGKTRVIITRIAYLIEQGRAAPGEIAAITFTRKAAGEMSSRLEELLPAHVTRRVWISTFHRLCGSILREHGARSGIRPDFGIADEAEQLDIMRQCMFDASVDIRIWKPQTLVQRMSVLKNMMKDAGSPEAWGKDEHRDRNASLANAYQAVLRKTNRLDFDDMLLGAVWTLHDQPEARTAVSRRYRHVKSEADGWTTLALPLLQFGAVRDESGESEASERAAMADHLFAATDGQLESRSLRVLRESYDRLARFERVAGSKLNSLRRLVLFGCFVLHVHAISRWHERCPARPRPPILLDMFDGTVRSVRDASRASLRAAGDAIEFLILDSFKERVRDIGTSKDELLGSLREQDADESVTDALQNYAGKDPVDALARAIVDAAFAKAREHPIGSLVELGRRAGFLSPWANSGRGGKLQKRYTATAEFLETLVAATVDPDDPLEFPEFLERLRDDFGILVGRPEDDSIIRHNNLTSPERFGPMTSINEEHLRRNVAALRHLLVETGYGKSYADGRTVITTEPEVLV